jgi:NAD(P)-dependent dehydrogenase (short-subunit alcohol dehydrogenase family)
VKDLNGRVAVVTGGANGIGLALAEALAREGMRIAIADIDAVALGHARERITPLGVECIAVKADVSKEVEVAALAQAVRQQLGNVHVLCSNAGVPGPIGNPVWELDLNDWRRVFAINTDATLHAIRHFIPHMLALNEDTHVVVTASIAGLVPSGIIPQYHASKHALVSLTETLRYQLEERGSRIGVSMVCPGAVDTQITAREASRNETATADTLRATVPNELYSDLVQPSVVADAIVHAIRNDIFYVYPNSATRERLRERFAQILAE